MQQHAPLFALALALALMGCDALSISSPRAPAPMRCARVAHLAVAMQEDEPAEPTESVPEPEPVVEAEEPLPPPPPAAEEMFSMPPLEDEEVVDEGAIAKDALKAEVVGGLRAESKPDRAVVGEILLALEAKNPTRSPATSPLLNGKWKFMYASAKSPGLTAVQLLLKQAKGLPKSPSGADVVDVADTFLSIGEEQPRASASFQIRLLSFDNTVKLTSRLEAESAVRLVETYESYALDAMDFKLPFQKPLKPFQRSLLVSYLDEELLVIRDAMGRPDILMRCDQVEWAASSLETEPESDGSAPGAS